MSELTTIEEVKAYIKKHYSHKSSGIDDAETSGECWGCGITYGENKALYDLGTLLGMTLKPMKDDE